MFEYLPSFHDCIRVANIDNELLEAALCVKRHGLLGLLSKMVESGTIGCC